MNWMSQMSPADWISSALVLIGAVIVPFVLRYLREKKEERLAAVQAATAERERLAGEFEKLGASIAAVAQLVQEITVRLERIDAGIAENRSNVVELRAETERQGKQLVRHETLLEAQASSGGRR